MRRSVTVGVLHPNPRQEPSMTEVSPLRRRMIEDMTVRNLSPATQQSYVYAVAKFGQFFKRSPERLDLEDVRAFQVHLVAGGVSWSALNQTVCALRFLYGVTLCRPDLPERIPHARKPRKLPVVLSADEVVRFLGAVPSLKCRAALRSAESPGGQPCSPLPPTASQRKEPREIEPRRARSETTVAGQAAAAAAPTAPDLLLYGPAIGRVSDRDLLTSR